MGAGGLHLGQIHFLPPLIADLSLPITSHASASHQISENLALVSLAALVAARDTRHTQRRPTLFSCIPRFSLLASRKATSSTTLVNVKLLQKFRLRVLLLLLHHCR